ncbi:unnamed protein product [Meloidogyne enterolobii]|uniref:Uncharacterized protein n=1 Tax=Meloidogyne enterolobii TaxID=390850 RepID=A0ACB1AN11_MELEN
MFFELNEVEKRIFKNLRENFTIYTNKAKKGKKYEDGEMVILDENNEEEIVFEDPIYIFELQPLFNFGVYDFEIFNENKNNIKKRKREEDNE